MQFSKSKVTNQGLDMQDGGQDSKHENEAWKHPGYPETYGHLHLLDYR